jgi:hypothetical protein
MAGFRSVLPEIIAAFVAARSEQRESEDGGRQQKFWRAAARTGAERRQNHHPRPFLIGSLAFHVATPLHLGAIS